MNLSPSSLPVVVGVTGASGTLYAARLLLALRKQGVPTHLVMSQNAHLVAEHEGVKELQQLATRSFDAEDLFAPPASGTARYRAMVVIPCSMGSLGRIAAGISDTLLTRAADVQLKEGRPLLLVPRETPLSEIHLENMLRLKRAGATILPASPFFYHHPKSIESLVDSVVGKLLDQLGIEHDLYQPWGSREG